ncbi:MAG: hypothetical protein K2N11_06670 [Mucispirillum sp.]|nr:hypothetical protein [Mucispirillum sp.]
MDNILKSRIKKGEKALLAAEYLLPLLKTYEKEILLFLEKGENIRKLHGMAYIIKKIDDDIKRDISHGEDAKKILINKSFNKE